MYKDWLTARGPSFRQGVRVATLDPFQGYKNAIDDQLDDATCVLDAFHIVWLATSATDDARRRIPQQTLEHRGRKGDPLCSIRTLLRAGRGRLTERQRARLQSAFVAHEDHISVEVAYQCAQDVRACSTKALSPRGSGSPPRGIEALPTCPIPEIAWLGRTLRKWQKTILAYFDTGGASNGGTEAVNGIIELDRRIARGFRNFEHYRFHMLLIAGGLDASTPTQL